VELKGNKRDAKRNDLIRSSNNKRNLIPMIIHFVPYFKHLFFSYLCFVGRSLMDAPLRRSRAWFMMQSGH
jgi:hypothetical protein